MAENKESIEFLGRLALMTEASQQLFAGKMSVVFELREIEYRNVISMLEKEYNPDNKQFKVDISGTDFIFLLDES